MLTDTHCHLYEQYYDDITSIIKNAEYVGVNRFINNGCNDKTNKEILKLIEVYPNMYGALGIHPSDVENFKTEDLEFIEKNLRNKKIVALGEIGLDYYWTKDNKDLQKNIFERQLKLAETYQIPVIVHNRDATKDVLEILRKFNVSGVIHSFSGSYETAMEFIKIGFLLGINGVVTFKNNKVKDVLTNISLDNIIIETDSPYLTPHPYRGDKNEPKNIGIIVEYLADYLHINRDEIVKITNQNIARVFDI